MRYFLTNNVRGVLAAAVAPSDVEIIVTKAAAPFNMPGTSGFGLQPSVLTLVDDLVAPTKIEVITFYSVQDDGATWTILDATRGEEGTTAQSWDVGDPVFQAATAGAISLPSFLYVDWNSGYLGVQGAPTVPLHVHGSAIVAGSMTVNQLRHASELNLGSISGATSVTWSSRNHQRAQLNGTTTFTFNTPGAPAYLTLRLSIGGAHAITWPSSVRWVGNVTPVHSTVVNRVDLFEFYFDGTTYWGSAKIGFVP